MSLTPFFFREMVRPFRMLEHQMRMAEEFFHPMVAFPRIRYQQRPAVENSEELETIVQDKNKFQVKLDVQHFAPQEIIVKAMDGTILIEAKHEEKEDDSGFISRKFIRRFVLSKDHDMKDVESTLSSDGILTITVPRKADPAIQERVIPITHTGPEKEKVENKTNPSKATEAGE